MEIAVVAGLALLLLAILLMLGRSTQSQKQHEQGTLDKRAQDVTQKGAFTKSCPLCGHGLLRGQTVKTRLVTVSSTKHSGGVQESQSTILGCPFCWPDNKSNPRVCPVCKDTLGPNDYVKARYFERTGFKDDGTPKRNHVHVLGCTRCHRGI